MRKDYYGFSRNEFIAVIAVFFSSAFLIVFCSVRLLHRYYKNDRQAVNKIRQHSSQLSMLNNLLTESSYAQRASLNLLIYTRDENTFKKNIETALIYRDSIKNKLQELESRQDFNTNDKRQIEIAGYKYLNTNEDFLNLIQSKERIEKADSFSVISMRPAVRAFTDLCRANISLIINKIDESNSAETNLFNQPEFWILLLGLLPWFYIIYRIAAIVWRIIFWKAF